MTPEEREAIKNELGAEVREMNASARSEELAKLKSELREGIEKETLKKEIIAETTPPESRAKAFIKHPATLLFLGFILTTFLGTIVSSVWKYWEWTNEQGYLKNQTRCERERQTRSDEIKQKYDVKDEIIRRVAETNTAAEEILLYFQMTPARRSQLRDERTKYWQEATRNWRINEKILRQRSLLRFQDPNVSGLLEKITMYRGWVGVNINNQQDRLSSNKKICTPIVNQAAQCMSHVTEELMPQLVRIMNNEIWKDEGDLRLAECLTPGPSPSPGSASTNPLPSPSKEPDECNKLQALAKSCDIKKKP